MTKPGTLSPSVKNRILIEYMASVEGREKLSRSMLLPARTRIHYHALYCKLLEQEPATPFCEPLKTTLSFQIPMGGGDGVLSAFEEGQELVYTSICKLTDEAVVARLLEAPYTEDVLRPNTLETLRGGRGGRFLVSDRTLAVLRETEDGELWLDDCVASELMPLGHITFVPKDAGRWCDVLENEVLPVEEGGDHATFEFTYKLCFEVDPAKVAALRIEMLVAPAENVAG